MVDDRIYSVDFELSFSFNLGGYAMFQTELTAVTLFSEVLFEKGISEDRIC